MLKGTSLLYSGGGEHGLYPEGVIIDRDTSLKEQARSTTIQIKLVPLRNKLNKQKTKGTSQNHNNGNKLVPLRTFNKVLNK